MGLENFFLLISFWISFCQDKRVLSFKFYFKANFLYFYWFFIYETYVLFQHASFWIFSKPKILGFFISVRFQLFKLNLTFVHQIFICKMHVLLATLFLGLFSDLSWLIKSFYKTSISNIHWKLLELQKLIQMAGMRKWSM